MSCNHLLIWPPCSPRKGYLPFGRAVYKASGRARRIILTGFLASLALLSGCQSLSTIKSHKTGQESRSLSEIQQWQLTARVAIWSQQENVTATLEWQKSGDDFDFHLVGFLGVNYAHLIQKGHQATLKIPKKPKCYHQDAEQLLYQCLGWDFPIDALSYWVKGLASNKSGESVSRNPKGQLEVVHFQGWRVEFSRYESYLGYLMPKKIIANHPQLSLKIVVKAWDFKAVE